MSSAKQILGFNQPEHWPSQKVGQKL